MTGFYEYLVGRRAGLAAPLPKAEALREAKHWLRNLSAEEADKHTQRLPPVERGEVRPRTPPAAGARPYAHPYYWAAFILLGDSD
jgi:CHAT domain-containing protein